MVCTEPRKASFSKILASRSLVGLGTLLAVTALAPSVFAQSAADKATARQLATEGIQLYRDKSYDKALEKLNRAESLYDAPPHLLYIARSYVALGQLVEGAEAYRRLVRAELPAGSPAAFATAVGEGEKELSELEPRIPSLKIDVAPSDASDLTVTVDGKPFNVAALGVERPTNPGKHVIEAKARGYTVQTKEVELAESKTDAIAFALVADPNAPELAPSGTATIGDSGVSSPGEKGAESGDKGFTLALRVGGFTRAGSGGELGAGKDAGDYFPGGFGGELDAGFRFMRYFQAKIFGQVFGLAKGDAIDDAATATAVGTQVTNEARGQGGGIAISAGTDPRKLGLFGELGFLTHQYVLSQKVVEAGSRSCEGTTTYSGNAMRLGVGGYIPIASSFNLTPMLAFTMGSITSIESEGDINTSGSPSCADQTTTKTQDGSFGNHEIFLGLGGEFMFGDSWFR